MNYEVLVPPKEAHGWLNDNLIGNITKENLEQERFKEINGQDMMSSALIIYHSESLLEMQFMCCITFAFILTPNRVMDSSINYEAQDKSMLVLYSLIGEHIFSYFSGIFRTWEIKHYGKVDVNGVARA